MTFVPWPTSNPPTTTELIWTVPNSRAQSPNEALIFSVKSPFYPTNYTKVRHDAFPTTSGGHDVRSRAGVSTLSKPLMWTAANSNDFKAFHEVRHGENLAHLFLRGVEGRLDLLLVIGDIVLKGATHKTRQHTA